MIKNKKTRSHAFYKAHLTCIQICFMLLVCLGLSACNQTAKPQETETILVESSVMSNASLDTTEEETVEEEMVEMIEIQTSVCPILFPADIYENLIHVETKQGYEVMEVFYYLHGENQRETFRILFSPSKSENAIGVMQMEEQNLYVSVEISNYADADFADVLEEETYYTIISSLNIVLESIQSDSRFCEVDAINTYKSHAELAYWNVNLPDQMSWEETVGTDDYHVSFYGSLGEEQVLLYSIHIGDEQLSSKLGYYRLNSSWKCISMESCDISETGSLDDTQVDLLYTMMATINDVIQAIISSENFSEQIPE